MGIKTLLEKKEVRVYKLEIPPILFIIFNRPDTTARVFEEIRKVRPARLFVAADAPRYPIKAEVDACAAALKIATNIDWECELHVLMQERNLGVGRGGAAAITWFFQQVEAGIILEDDCVPSEQFFEFCAQGLIKFKDDASVMMIAGTNYLLGRYATQAGYYLSRFYPIWGWATWRRAWALYDFDISHWEEELIYKRLRTFFSNKLLALRWAKIFDDIKNKRLEAWDVQWVFACVKNHGYTLTAPFNMISNIGINGGHTNGVKAWVHEMPYQSCNVTEILRNPLSATTASKFDLEVYSQNGFLYKEPFYRVAGRAVLHRFPLLRAIYGGLKKMSRVE